MSTNYEIDYNDERFDQVESDKKAALSDIEKTYGGMIDNSDKYYQTQIEASKEWADKQTQLQQEKTDFAIEEIEQQKEQAQKDYTKEQSGAYTDWQKQSNQYGVNAEQMAASGMENTGYSESSQVSMYNTYQNRVATAREVYNRAILNYNNSIKEARLQNNSVLAEIAYNALQQELELSLQGFQYKNQLIIDKANKITELNNTYYNHYLNVLDQINTENALAEEIRQYNEQMAEEKRQYDASLALQQAQLAEEQRQFNANNNSSGDGSVGIEKATGDSSKTTSDSSKTINIGGMTTVLPNSSNDELPVNMDSVNALGYGPISASRLNELVASGEVVEYEKDGMLYYRKKTKLDDLLSDGVNKITGLLK